MPHVIKEECLGEQYASCVKVCPVSCIYPGNYKGETFMIIHPTECIDCALCIPECPVGAIVGTGEEGAEWTKVNADLAEEYKKNPPVEGRPVDETPKKPYHKLVKGG